MNKNDQIKIPIIDKLEQFEDKLDFIIKTVKTQDEQRGLSDIFSNFFKEEKKK